MKKGFTLVELISVIALLGILLVVVGTKGFGAFDKTKDKISIENENTIREAANFLMTEVKSCEGNEDIYGNLFDKYLTEDEKNNKPCEKLIEKATKKANGTGCLDIDLKYLIEKKYITSDGVKKINDKYSDYTIQGCLDPQTKKVIVSLPKEEDLTTTTTTTSSTTSTTTPKVEEVLAEPIINYNNPKTNYIYNSDNLKGQYFLEEIENNNINCNDDSGKTTCKTIEYQISGSSNFEKDYNYSRIYDLETENSELISGNHDEIFEPGQYKLIITAKNENGKTATIYYILNVIKYPYYSFGFYGPYYFDDGTIVTGELLLECLDQYGKGCYSYFNQLMYNGELIDWWNPGDNKIFDNLKEGYYDIYFEAVDEFGNATYETFEDAIYVYNTESCGYYQEECESYWVDNGYEDEYCEWYEYECNEDYIDGPCIDWTSAYQDNAGALDMESYCVEYEQIRVFDICEDKFCEPVWVENWQEEQICKNVWVEEPCY